MPVYEDESVTVKTGYCRIVARRRALSVMQFLAFAVLIFIPVGFISFGLILQAFDAGFADETALTIGFSVLVGLGALLISLIIARATFGEPGELISTVAGIGPDGLSIDGKPAVVLKKCRKIQVVGMGSSIPIRAKFVLVPMMLIWLLWTRAFGRSLPRRIAGPVPNDVWLVKVGPRPLPAFFYREDLARQLASALREQFERHSALNEARQRAAGETG
ncbi:hypothetical protein WNY37_00940 [Henriciella sp. AS95]|uniref:hypothetical protein n=1 Tax=Henriciella sp. AS95 TaxID=3135782 RepID=UPI0031821B0C